VYVDKTGQGAITTLLADYAQGDSSALEQIIRHVYPELRRIARRIMAGERVDHTLSATGLVHEGFLRLFAGTRPEMKDSRHFFLTAARVMEHVLTDHARKKLAEKRSGDCRLELPTVYRADDLAAIAELLGRLEATDTRAAQVVRLRFYMGMTNQETAAALGVTQAIVQQDWKWARAWLRAESHGAWRRNKAVCNDSGPARYRQGGILSSAGSARR
jgi:RNA polymerase sigma factor (TIGR02999 family)